VTRPSLLPAIVATLLLLVGVWWPLSAAEPGGKPLEVARLDRADPVDFYREVLPALQVNCLPCHNKTTTKADLLMETPADMLRGGESGPALVPGKASESLLFQLAAHLQKPRMPPKDNKVNAVNLSPQELGLLALWIDQGAQATGQREEVIVWQPLAAGVRPILGTAVTADGQWVASGRGNQLDLYHLPTGQRVARLEDPSLAAQGLPGVAHRDWVSAVAFSPDGRRLASGGFREIKMWERSAPRIETTSATGAAPSATNGVWVSSDGSRQVRPGTNGMFVLTDAAGAVIAPLEGTPEATQAVRAGRAAVDRSRLVLDQHKARLDAAQKEVQAQRERLQRAREALAAAHKVLAEKDALLNRARREQLLAEVRREVVVRAAGGQTNAPEYKPADEAFTAARTAAEKAEAEQRPAALKASTADNERTLAIEGGWRAESVQARAAWLFREAGEDLRAAEVALKAAEDLERAGRVPLRAASFSPDNQSLVTADQAGRVVRWIATNGVPVESVRSPGVVKALGIGAPDQSVVSTDGGDFAVTWTPQWNWVATLTNTLDGRLADRIGTLAFSPDGRWLVSGGGEPSRSGEVWFWDAASGNPVFGLTNLHSDAVLSAAFSPDGRWLATGGADRFARLVEVASGRQVRALEGHTGHVLGVGWRADGQLLATAGADLSVKFWDPVTGERRKQATGFAHEVTSVAHLAGTNQWVVASGDNELRVINENGDRVRGLSGANDFTQALAVTADGQWILTGGQEGILRAWNSTEEVPRITFPSDGSP